MTAHPALFDTESLNYGLDGEAIAENPAFLSKQLITYIGNKRSLLPQIELAVNQARSLAGGRRLNILDAFAGSGVVSRFMKRHAAVLHSNDFETYGKIIADCFLVDRGQFDTESIEQIARDFNERFSSGHRVEGFFAELYAPQNMDKIKAKERCFYSPDNAARLDTFRADLEHVDVELRTMLMGPLLAEASRHVNTGGVFKGFYKDKAGVGKFGGAAGAALQRILAPIQMSAPLLSRYDCEVVTHQRDANELIGELTELDLIYIDPPYNQHPYGSNYFMLNLLVKNERPTDISKVSGIPVDWQRSPYNKRSEAFIAFRDFTVRAQSRFLLISYSDEGFIAPEEMRAHLDSLGNVTEIRTPYAAYRASRNLDERPKQVTEHLYLLDKDGGLNGTARAT